MWGLVISRSSWILSLTLKPGDINRVTESNLITGMLRLCLMVFSGVAGVLAAADATTLTPLLA